MNCEEMLMLWKFNEKQGFLEFVTWVMITLLKQFLSMSKPFFLFFSFLFPACETIHFIYVFFKFLILNAFAFRLSSRIIWLGDLNYRIALSYRSAKAFVEMRNWKALLENDQASPNQNLLALECHIIICLI